MAKTKAAALTIYPNVHALAALGGRRSGWLSLVVELFARDLTNTSPPDLDASEWRFLGDLFEHVRIGPWVDPSAIDKEAREANHFEHLGRRFFGDKADAMVEALLQKVWSLNGPQFWRLLQVLSWLQQNRKDVRVYEDLWWTKAMEETGRVATRKLSRRRVRS